MNKDIVVVGASAGGMEALQKLVSHLPPDLPAALLTGALDDGTAGLWTIKLRGGTAIVQEPAEALVRSMPLNALDNG